MGRPKLEKNKARKQLSVKVSCETHEFLKDKPEGAGRVIDSLVRYAIDKGLYENITDIHTSIDSLSNELRRFQDHC